jgi:probable rRNA maturation factor
MNRKFRNRDYATDVLSFSYGGITMEGLPFLGEIIIAPEAAATQAVRCGSCLEREMRKLILHGILHLMGYDHERDRGWMNRIQAKLMRRKVFSDTPALTNLRVNR